MKISTKGRYGLRAIIDIAAHDANEPIPIKEVSSRQEISENYLEQIIFPLKRAGIVKSVRGAQGGYLLSRPASKITVGEVLRALEGDLSPVECLANGEEPDCSRAQRCATLPLWRALQEAINQVVDNTTIQDLVDNHQKTVSLDFGAYIENVKISQQKNRMGRPLRFFS